MMTKDYALVDMIKFLLSNRHFQVNLYTGEKDPLKVSKEWFIPGWRTGSKLL